MLRLLFFLAIFCIGLIGAGPARAATCEAQMSDIAFGAVSLRAGAVNRTTGSLTVSCSNALVSAVGVCIRFGPGSGGAGSGNSPRYMTGSTGQSLAWQMRLGGHGQAFGTLNQVYMLVPVVLGSGQATIPIFAEILGTGTEFDTGAYQSVFSGQAHVEMSYGIVSCNLFGQSHPVPEFRVSAETVASCELDVGALNFGRITSLATGPADADAAVDIRCTSGANYSVSLGLGNGTGVSDPAYRRLQSVLGSLTYGLFRDVGRTMVWGEGPSQRANGTGTGYNQRYQVYGRIYQGQDTQIGSYSDSVVVTVHY